MIGCVCSYSNMFLLKVILLTTLSVLLTHDIMEEEGDMEVGEVPEVDEVVDGVDIEEEMIEREDGEDGEDREESIYISSLELEHHSVEIISEKKEGTIWLIVDCN